MGKIDAGYMKHSLNTSGDNSLRYENQSAFSWIFWLDEPTGSHLDTTWVKISRWRLRQNSYIMNSSMVFTKYSRDAGILSMVKDTLIGHVYQASSQRRDLHWVLHRMRGPAEQPILCLALYCHLHDVHVGPKRYGLSQFWWKFVTCASLDPHLPPGARHRRSVTAVSCLIQRPSQTRPFSSNVQPPPCARPCIHRVHYVKLCLSPAPLLASKFPLFHQICSCFHRERHWLLFEGRTIVCVLEFQENRKRFEEQVYSFI